MLFTARLVDASVQIGDNNSSQLLGLLGGLNELRGVKPLEQLLAQPKGSVSAVTHSSIRLPLRGPCEIICQSVHNVPL